MFGNTLRTALAAGVLTLFPAVAEAQTVEELQRQIDELKAAIRVLTEARNAPPAVPVPAPAPITPASPPPVSAAVTPVQARPDKPWYERLQLRGYVQMRNSEIVSGDKNAPAGLSRLRSVHDSGIGDGNNFTLRRVRLVVQGDITDRLSLYLQPDFATAIGNGSERREGVGQLRDAYVDVFLDKGKTFRLRFGQSKVPYGWENLQSSSNRLTLDRSDAINSMVPGERDLGVIAYYTPPRVQRIWDRLEADGQKLFGNYGAFAFGLLNGQGINRSESNDHLMQVAMATWPFALDGLGGMFEGQVLEVGAAVIRNKVQPEIRSGGLSAVSFDDNRIGVHAILYPKPFGLQAEWNWGRGPQFDDATQAIRATKLRGGYVQAMVRIEESPVGEFLPYARWQHYRGGWKAAINAPRLETDEIELGVEWHPMTALEFTFAYARMQRREADERRFGRAKGDVIRTQLQFSY
jgi:hypothetical protein